MTTPTDCLDVGIVALGALAESCPRGAKLRLLTELADVAARPSRYSLDEYDAVLARLRAFQRDKRIFDDVVAHAILRDAFRELGVRTSARRA